MAKPTSGKYSNRDELVQNVHFFYYHTEQCVAQVARTTGISEGTVNSILKKKPTRVTL